MTELRDTPPVEPAAPARSRLGGCLRALGIGVLLIVVLAVIAFIALYVSISQSYRGPEARPAPVAWSLRDVTLTRQAPAVHGRLDVTTTSSEPGTTRLGLTVDLPRPASDPRTPGEQLHPPAVRLSTDQTSGGVGSCLAPCEVAVTGLDCSSGACRQTIEFTIEWLDDDDGVDGPVRVTVAGGGTEAIGAQLPDGFAVDLSTDDGGGG